MSLRHTLDSLLIYDPHRSQSTVNVWVSRPTPSEAEAAGTVFLVSAIDDHRRTNHEIISLLQEELKRQYYAQPSSSLEHSFEVALDLVNRRLQEIIKEGVKEWVERSHFVAGVIWHRQFVISPVGTMPLYLFRNQRLHDVVDTGLEPEIKPLKIFDEVIAGHLEAGDQLLICSPTILDYFSVEKIRRLMVGHQPSEIVRGMESALIGVDPSVSFATLIVRFDTAEQTATVAVSTIPSSITPGAPQTSMSDLIANEEKTSQILSPSIWPALGYFFLQIGRGMNRLFRLVVLRRPPRRIVHSDTETTSVYARPEYRRQLGQALWRDTTKAIQNVTQQLLAALRSLTQRRHPTETTAPAAVARTVRHELHPQNFFHRLVRWCQRLNRRQQLAIVIGLVLVIIFTGALARTDVTDKAADTTGSGSPSIDDLIGRAQAALLYGGEDQARQLLDEAQAVIDRLPHRSKTDKQQQADFQTNLNVLGAKINRLTIIAQPDLVLDYSTTASNFQPTHLYLSGDRLLVYDPNARAMGVTTIGADTPPEITANQLDTGQPLIGVPTTANVITFVTERQTFVDFNGKTATWQPLIGQLPTVSADIVALAWFQNKLYALDRQANQIVRFTRGGANLGTGLNWLKETTDLKNAQDLAVDGTIYLLGSNGQVTSYFSGRISNFSLATISPALKTAIRLWTDAASKNIYVLDRDNSRLVVFNKEGRLVDQYQSPVWADLKDLAVNEAEKQAWVLNGSSVYRIPLAR